MNSTTLYYIHDPMCSWCWGFDRTWRQVQSQIKHLLNIQYVLGGLAPDSHEPMSDEMRHYIQANWLKIQQTLPDTQFNFDFWEKCTPQRSTYPACRAVIAAKNQHERFEFSMIDAIQNAYYLHAENPSEEATLIKLAAHMGLDLQRFIKDLNSTATHAALDKNRALSKSLGANGFPSLVLRKNGINRLIQMDYHHPECIIKQILA